MKRLLSGVIIMGAMVSQLTAEAKLPGGVLVLYLGRILVIAGTSSQNCWGDPSCGRPGGRNGDKSFPSWGYACDPFYAGNYGGDHSAPSVTIAIPQAVAPAPPPPAPPVRPEVREYHWPSSGSHSSGATFSIVSKDGRVQSAAMVWVQDNTLCYLAPGGSQGRMPIDSIDRQATRQRNAEKHLNFWLPAED